MNTQIYKIANGRFSIKINSQIQNAPSIEILKGSKILLKSVKTSPFIRAAYSIVNGTPIHNGNFQLSETLQYISHGQIITSIKKSDKENSLTIFGYLTDEQGSNLGSFYFILFLDKYHSMKLKATVNMDDKNYSFNRLYLDYWTSNSESFYGFGESFSLLNLRGRDVPILVSEQGVGRGEQPITDYFNNNIDEGSGGYWYTTYAPKAIYITSEKRGMYFGDNSEVMYLNISNYAQNKVSVEIWNTTIVANILDGNSIPELVTQLTQYTGRMKPLPFWSQSGAIVGLEGGTDNVTRIVDELLDAGVEIAGVWLQDWVGLRHGSDGDRLIWNWEVNYDWYPGWNDMVAYFSSKKIKVLTYINPFFSDPTNYTNYRRNFYQEGIDNGYFIKRADGTPYKQNSLTIEFCQLDPTNPEAVSWLMDIISEQMMGEASSSGWMCDFGEYLPFDAVLSNGMPAADYHNKYPEEWARINDLATSSSEEQPVFFMRSSWTKSPLYVPVFWLGDQNESWDENDGLQSALTGALSSGITGQTITHSDIGGYNFIDIDLGNGSSITYIRTQELLMRWSEFGAFGSGLFRTHIGSSTSPLAAQVYDTQESMEHFGKFASLFAALSDYRNQMMLEAQSYGYPLIRPMFFHYEDLIFWNMTHQYLFGSEFLITPVMQANKNNVTVFIPADSGEWVQLWGGFSICGMNTTKNYTIPSQIGFPSVFFKSSSQAGWDLRDFILNKQYSSDYIWEDSGFTSSCEQYQSMKSSNNKYLKHDLQHNDAVNNELLLIISVIAIILYFLSNTRIFWRRFHDHDKLEFLRDPLMADHL